MIRSRTGASRANGTVELSSARASPSTSPRTSSCGRCRSSSPGSRAANTSPTGSASSRRATKASVSAEVRSSHCASSTTHSSGRCSAASETRLSTARPTRNRSGASPGLRPKTIRSASRCGPGSRSSRSRSGAHSWCRLAKASSISDSTPTARATVTSERRLDEVLQQRRLPDPGLAAQHQRPALAAADVIDQVVQLGALVGAPEEAHVRQASQMQTREPTRVHTGATGRGREQACRRPNQRRGQRRSS